jgi:HPt (histidine-containing phosphotransfer) domain-containing protein
MGQANPVSNIEPFDPAKSHRERPIDLVHLARQTMGDRGLECEILKLFDRQMRQYVERIRNTHDRAALAMEMHTLKGSAFGVGAEAIGKLAQTGEREIARHGGVSPELLGDLETAIAEANAYIADILAE